MVGNSMCMVAGDDLSILGGIYCIIWSMMKAKLVNFLQILQPILQDASRTVRRKIPQTLQRNKIQGYKSQIPH
jgi:hypothetical protein